MTFSRHGEDGFGYVTNGRSHRTHMPVGLSMVHGHEELEMPERVVSQDKGLRLASALWLKYLEYGLSHLFRQSPCNELGVRVSSSWKPSKLFMPVLVLLCAKANYAIAAPIYGAQGPTSNEAHKLSQRQISANTWIPAVAICGFILILISWTCWWHRKYLFNLLCSRASTDIPNANVAEGEPLTAERLVGTINNPGPGNHSGTTRTRRLWRLRRTPSQRSTHSLPVYEKEPGDRELVVLQGPPDEDVSEVEQPVARVVASVDEGPEISTDSDPQSPITPPQEASAEFTTLLGNNTTCTLPAIRPSSASTNDEHGRTGSQDTRTSVDLTSLSPIRRHPSLLDVRGEAPPYFEVVGQGNDDGAVQRAFMNPGSPNSPSSTGADDRASPLTWPQPSPPRRSGFRSMLNRPLSAGLLRTFTRPGSSGSGRSSGFSHSPNPYSRSHTRAASITSIFRPVSRQKSFTSHNASSSTISLNSISAPLTHTVVRTEFAAYPKAGMTPEQMRFISSREGLAKFGVPYGPDAVAFAFMSGGNSANGERPPDFEAVVGNGGINGGANSTIAADTPDSTSGEGVQTQETTLMEGEGDNQASSSSVDDLSMSRSVDSSSGNRETVKAPVDIEGVATTIILENARNEGQPEKGVDEREIEGIIEERPIINKGKGKETFALGDQDPPEESKPCASAACVASTTTDGPSAPPEQPPATSIATPTSPEPEATVTSLAEFGRVRAPFVATIILPTSTTQAFATKPSLPPMISDSMTSRAASSLSYASFVSNDSNGTFRTAVESMTSRRRSQWSATADEDDAGYDTADDGGHVDKEYINAPTIDPTSAASVKQNRPLSTATVTGASDVL